MQFREVKMGQNVFLFDRKEISVKVCRVNSASAPHFDGKFGNNPAQMVVDIVIDVDGKPASYCMKDCSDSAYIDNIVITPNNDVLLRELEGMKMQSEQSLQMVDHHKNVVDKCKQLLLDYNPSFKEKQQTEQRFSNLEESIDEMKSLMKKLLAK